MKNEPLVQFPLPQRVIDDINDWRAKVKADPAVVFTPEGCAFVERNAPYMADEYREHMHQLWPDTRYSGPVPAVLRKSAAPL